MSKKQKLALVSVLTLSFVFVVLLPRAFGVGWEVLNPQYWLLWILQNTVFRLLAVLIAALGMIFDWLISMTGAFVNSPVVMSGWTAMRDLVNIGFIFILLIIAISTILGIEKYGMKALFANLIIIALLINFSMVFAKIIIDATQLLTNYFITQSTGYGNISNTIMGALGVAKIHQAAQALSGGGLAGVGAEMGSMAIAIIMNIIVLLGVLIVLGLACAMLLVRLIALSVLIIVAPVAFFARILPETKNLWDKWWKQFINYAIFAPAFAFFLWLALLFPQVTGTDLASMSKADVPDLGFLGNVFFASGNLVLIYLMTMGFLFAAIIMAQKLGMYGGAKVVGWAQAGMKKATGYQFAKTKSLKYAKDTWAKTKTGLSRQGARLLGAERLQAVPVIGRLAQRAQIETAIQERKGNKAIVDKYSDWKESELGDYWQHLSKREQAVLLADRAEKKKAHKLDLDDDVVRATTKNMPKYQAEYTEVFKYNPSLALEMPEFYEKDKNAQDIARIRQVLEQEGLDSHTAQRVATIEFAFSKMGSSDLTGMKAGELEKAEALEAFLSSLRHKKIDKRQIGNILSSDNGNLINRVAQIMADDRLFNTLPEEFRNYWNASFVQGLGFVPQQPTPTPTPTPTPAPAGGGTP